MNSLLTLGNLYRTTVELHELEWAVIPQCSSRTYICMHVLKSQLYTYRILSIQLYSYGVSSITIKKKTNQLYRYCSLSVASVSYCIWSLIAYSQLHGCCMQSLITDNQLYTCCRLSGSSVSHCIWSIITLWHIVSSTVIAHCQYLHIVSSTGTTDCS